MKKRVPQAFRQHLLLRRRQESQVGEDETAVTPRSVLVGLLASGFIGVAAPHICLIINGSRMAHNFSTPAALFVFFVFTLIINVGLGLCGRRYALTRPELAVVYIMALLATSIPTIGFTQNLLPVIAGLYYYASPENNWAELMHPHVPAWIAPQDQQAVTDFHEGLPAGASVPWAVWRGPLLYWSLFIGAFYWVSMCTVVILRRQWVQHEKLPYPLAQLPVEMIQDDERRSLVKPIFTNGVMWVGFAVPFIIGSLNALHHYDSVYPHIDTDTSLTLFAGLGSLRLDLNVALVGFAYLLSREVALGFWLFFLLSTLERRVLGVVGLTSTESLSRFAVAVGPYLAHQAMGAMIALVLSGVWTAREHLAAVWRKAFRADPQVDDSGEVLSYRTAVWGLLAGLAVVGGWLWCSGFPLWVVPIFLFGVFVVFMAITRAVVEGGISVIRTPLTPSDFVVSGLGSSALGAPGLMGAALTYVWAGNIRIFFLPCFANALRVAEEIRGNRRRVAWAVILAVAVALAASMWSVLTLSYRYGGINLHGMFVAMPVNAFGHMAPKFADPVPASMAGWGFTALGAGLMGLLTYARYRFVWWPVNPLGFATGTFNIMEWVWFSVFVAWLLKTIMLRNAAAGYAKTRLFFLGLILGQISMAGMWLAIDFYTGKTGNILGYF